MRASADHSASVWGYSHWPIGVSFVEMGDALWEVA
jgi:hypothetical protein